MPNVIEETVPTTIKEFIAYLQTLPDDTRISVIDASLACGYDVIVNEVDLNLDPINGNVTFTDLTGNQFVKKGDPHFNKKFLLLGEK